MIILSVTMFLQCLNTSLITVPLPRISSDLGIDVTSSSWLLLAYSIGTCALLLQFTKYARNGRTRSFFIYGLILFLFASFDCSLSHDYLTLVILRFIQGASISMAVATGPIFVVQRMPEELRGTALGMMAAGTGLAMAIGPSVGGVLAETISWHMLFLINIPIGLAVLATALRVIPEDTGNTDGKDPGLCGSLALFAVIACGLMLLENLMDWTPKVLSVMAVVTFLSTTILIWHIRSADGVEPVVSPNLLKSRLFMLIAVSAAVGSMVTEGAFYLLPYFMEISWGMSVTECGFYFCIVSATTFVCARLAGRYCDANSSKIPTVCSFVCTATFSTIFAVIIPGSSLALLIMSACMVGASFAVFETAQYLRMIRNTEPEYREESATLITVVTYIGASLGLIFYSIVFDIAVPVAKDGMESLSATAMANGFHMTGILGIILSVIGLAVAMKVPHDRLGE